MSPSDFSEAGKFSCPAGLQEGQCRPVPYFSLGIHFSQLPIISLSFVWAITAVENVLFVFNFFFRHL